MPKHSNAIHVTIYDMSGAPLPPEVAEKLEEVAVALAQENKLIVAISRD